MTVYVDDMLASYGRMKMCHMIADTEEELHAMADKIGVHRKWYQGPPKTRHMHYDIALSKRELAIKNGAVEITQKQTVCILWCITRGVAFSSPEDAYQKRMYEVDGGIKERLKKLVKPTDLSQFNSK